MRFTVLGSGTTVPDPSRGPAGFLVQVGERAWLVDGGSGTLQRCAAAGVDPRQLSGGFYSHRHPDHCSDLPALLFAMYVAQRTDDYLIWAGSGFTDYFSGLSAAYGKSITLAAGAEVRVEELPLDGPGFVDLGDLRLKTLPAAHTAGALHLAFEADGRRVVFSGDTGPSENLSKLATQADLLVCECGASDSAPYPGHLAPSEVAAIVDAARPREVWLTHFYPQVDPEYALHTVARTGVRVRRANDLDAWGIP